MGIHNVDHAAVDRHGSGRTALVAFIAAADACSVFVITARFGPAPDHAALPMLSVDCQAAAGVDGNPLGQRQRRPVLQDQPDRAVHLDPVVDLHILLNNIPAVGGIQGAVRP